MNDEVKIWIPYIGDRAWIWDTDKNQYVLWQCMNEDDGQMIVLWSYLTELQYGMKLIFGNE